MASNGESIGSSVRPEFVFLAAVPGVRGLEFRGFDEERDFPSLLEVIERSKVADGADHTESLEDLKRNYQHLVNSDTATDVVLAEVASKVIGYGRVWWRQEVNGPYAYGHFAFLVPEWRGTGIRRAMLRHNESRLRAIATGHPGDAPKAFECWASERESDWVGLLESEGYVPARYGFEMVRPMLGDLPEAQMPEALEVRPVQPEHYLRIWAAAREAFRDHWGFSEEDWADTHLASWQESPTFVPDYWQVAWEGDEIAGMVLNFVDHAENEEYHRQRGYTETICVRRPWRRRGLARALIARSLRLHRDLGMTETALGVDATNPNGALQLYESMGYEVVNRQACYRKPLEALLPDEETEST
ncbi:MAG: GNAT family N-acetyltransferase [Anaerolineae bacterium]|jgi:GNAT superfamily N-acetyltransferase|nr:GNAT family N-acetyltransferase [Anaerolineae bacterium]